MIVRLLKLFFPLFFFHQEQVTFLDDVCMTEKSKPKGSFIIWLKSTNFSLSLASVAFVLLLIFLLSKVSILSFSILLQSTIQLKLLKRFTYLFFIFISFILSIFMLLWTLSQKDFLYVMQFIYNGCFIYSTTLKDLDFYRLRLFIWSRLQDIILIKVNVEFLQQLSSSIFFCKDCCCFS